MSGGDGGPRRIIVVRRKGGHHEEHHGGSWKVAYADFVTAMMAFFLVMWILGMDAGVRDLVQGYFANPIGYRQGFDGGHHPLSLGGGPITPGLRNVPVGSMEEQRIRFQRTAVAIRSRLQEAQAMSGVEAHVEAVVSDWGLRVELMDTGEQGAFFDLGSARIRPALESVLSIIAPELGNLPNGIVVEGHTDARPFGSASYSNWELATERANAARRILLETGVIAEHRILEVRGYADRRPRNPGNPDDPRNRRISLLIPFYGGAETLSLDTAEPELIPSP